MKLYDTFDQLWNEYFTQDNASTRFDAWTIAKFTHVDDEAYRQQVANGRDVLGFQPTMLTLGNPLQHKKEEMVIKGLSSASVQSLREQYRQRFTDQLPARFGLFHSDKKQADAIYDTWEQFVAEWLERNGQSTIKYNLPVLFDHVSDLEYWGWKQKGFDPCGTQRLIVTVFQYRTGRFAEVFITNVSDVEMSRIKLLSQSRLTLQAQELF